MSPIGCDRLARAAAKTAQLMRGALQVLRKYSWEFTLFLGASGVGWLADTAVFIGAVACGLPPFWGGLAGALTGASIAFTSSRSYVFGPSTRGVSSLLAVYLLYTLVLTLLLATLLAAVFEALSSLSRNIGSAYESATLALMAKIIVTPITVALNYVTARFLLKRV